MRRKSALIRRGPGRSGRWMTVAVVAISSVAGLAVGYGATTGFGLVLATGGVVLFGVAAQRRADLAYVVLAAFLLVQGWLASVVGVNSTVGNIVNQADDALIVILAVICLANAVGSGFGVRLPGGRWAGLFLIAGLMSSLLVSSSLPTAVLGAYLALKFYIMVITAANITWRLEPGKLVALLYKVGLPIVGLGMLDIVGSATYRGLVGLPPLSNEMRAGLTAASSVFVHPGIFGWFMAFTALVFAAQFIARGDRHSVWMLAIFAVAAIFSLKLKPILGLVVALPIGLLFGAKYRTRSAAGILLASLVVVGVLGGVASEVVGLQLQQYVTGDATSGNARNALYSTSIRIAADRFPLGVGFGRFGSFPSVDPYSPVYGEYGIAAVYGLSRAYPHFVLDTFWPAVLGESGVLGLLAYCMMLVVLLRTLAQASRDSESGSVRRMMALAGFMVLIEALMESIGAPALSQQPTVALVALPIGYALSWGASGGSRLALSATWPLGARTDGLTLRVPSSPIARSREFDE